MSSSLKDSNPAAQWGRQRKAGRSGVGLAGSLIAVFLPLVVGPLILLGLILYQQARNNLTAQAAARLNSLADIKKTEMDRWTTDRTASLISLSRSPDMIQNILALRQTPDEAAARDSLASRLGQFLVLSPDFQKLLVAEADTGRVIFVFPSGSENLLNVSFLDDSFFRQGRNTPFFIPPVANLKLDPASPSIVVVAPVSDPRTGVIGVLVGVIRLERFLSFLTADAEGVGASGQVYVIISSGYLLQSGAVAGGGVKPVSDGIERALGSHQDGTAFYANPSGVPVYGAYRWLARYEVALLVEQQQAALYAPLDRLAPTFVIGLGAAILLGVGAVFFFARRITRPLQRLTESATHMAGGDLTAQVQIERRAPREIGLLGQSFNTMAVQLRQTLEGLQQNVTELKRTEQALRQSEERYRSLVEGVPIGIYRSTPAGQILDANPVLVEMLDYPDRETFLATNVADLYADHQDRVQENAVLENQEMAHSFEARLRRRDGTMLWVRDTARAVRNTEGKVTYYEGSLENITERKRAEEEIRKLNQELEQRILERTAQLQAANQELEAFSYSVSHDLRAPLRSMEGFSAALLSDYSDKLDEQGQHYLERIQQAAQRMGQLISDLLDLSRITRHELTSQSVDLGNLAREIAAELQTLDPQRQAEFVIAEPLTVQGDSHLLRIALQNLLGNAWKFSGTRPKAIIKVGQMTVSDFKLQNENWDSRLSQSQISNPQSIIYYVSDNGVGFDMERAAKLFAPFQRLHAMNEFPGTGIGLAIVQRVIARHGGRIWVHAQVDQGATFYFTLEEKMSR